MRSSSALSSSSSSSLSSSSSSHPSSSQHSKNSDIPPCCILFCGNLAHSVSEGDLIRLFSKYGEVKSVNYKYDRQSGLPRGFAFVEMSNLKEAALCIHKLHMHPVRGKNIMCRYSIPSNAAGGDTRGGGEKRSHSSSSSSSSHAKSVDGVMPSENKRHRIEDQIRQIQEKLRSLDKK